MKNYLEHEFYDKYYDAKDKNQQNYQWVIDHLEQTYAFIDNDVKSYSEYLKVKSEYMDVIRLLIDINKLGNIIYEINNLFLSELNKLSLYYLNIIKIPKVKDINQKYNNFFSLFYVGIFIAKTDNTEKMLYDITWIETKNVFQISSMKFDRNQVKVINSFIFNLNMEDSEKMISIFKDNINRVESKYDSEIFEKISLETLKYNLFTFHSIRYDKNFLTWQEKYLIDIVGVEIDRDGIKSNIVMRDGTSYPDVTKWTFDVINNLVLFFNNNDFKVVLEILNYYKNNITPSDNTINICLEFLVNSIDDFIANKIKRYQFDNIYLLICGKMFKDNLINISLKRVYLPKIHSKLLIGNNFDLINLCFENNIPLNRNIKQIILDYYIDKCKKISSISSYSDFVHFIDDITIKKMFNTTNLLELHIKFLELVDKSDGISLASLFTIYIKFILSVQKNNNIDIEKSKQITLELIILWKERYFEVSRNSLHSFKNEIKIENEQIEAINDEMVKKTYLAVKSILNLSEKEIIEKLKSFSTVPMYVMMKENSYIVDTDFPYKLKRDFTSENPVGLLIHQYLDKIIDENGYRFLNQFKTDLYQHALYDNITQTIIFYISLFTKYTDLYQIIRDENKLYDLVNLEDKIKVAHTTQLFPLLEIKIKELGIIHGIVPFKENEDDYTKTKEPSSILREIILKDFQKEQKIVNISDLLFVYFCIYDANMLNIRNELIHGRRYLFLGDEEFAFKISLIGLKLVLDRIKRDRITHKSKS